MGTEDQEYRPVKGNELKHGMALDLDDGLYIITAAEHVKPGKGPAYVQCKLKSVGTGNVTDRRFRAQEEVNRVNLDRREMQYLYADSTGYVFMDNETFDQVSITEHLLGGSMQYVKPNTDIIVLFHEDRPVSVELPKTVDLEVTHTAPQPKGSTATNQLKEAELETGLKTRVPPFVENGQVVRISTEDASYVSKA
jgi:elongation factor P